MRIDTLLEYATKVKTLGNEIQVLENLLAEKRQQINPCISYMRVAKQRGFVRKLSQYDYRVVK